MSEEAGQGKTSAKRRFAAFISYAHADAAIAAKLQSKLERYRLPKHIAEAHTEGEAALGQIFRDREDLAAAPSLSDAIRNAISEAEALVVICSPDAKASRWVGEEIALFRTLHPSRPILAAIVRGEPDEAFPEALTEGGTEPLAADLRPEADGEALGFLKIVAGIAGVPLDALVQRDAQRRLRRVTWITAGALAAMLVMGIMTTFAIQARNEAARQRAEAEGLVEYMLTDLRAKLRGVGRLDVMESVNQRAMEYYGGSSVKWRLLNAQGLHAMGEDFEKRGELGKAEVKFQEAHKITNVLFKASPDNADVVFAHAQSEYWVGRVAELKQDWNKAESQYQRYRNMATQLKRLTGNDKRSLLEAGHAEVNLGIVAMSGENDIKTARSRFAAAQSSYSAAAKFGRETDQEIYYRANAAAWLADTFYADEEFEKSLDQRRLELLLNERVAARDVGNAGASYLVAKTQLALAKNLLKLKNSKEAESILVSAKARMKRIVSLDPANDEWAYQYFRIASNLAIAGHFNGNSEATRSNLVEMLSFTVRYRTENPSLFAKMEEGVAATRKAISSR
jgi:tetratricopeptide (TPR) repeat protein